MTTIRYDHTEIKHGGKRKHLSDAQKRQLIVDAEDVLNNDTDELTVRRGGSHLSLRSSRDCRAISVRSDYAQDRT